VFPQFQRKPVFGGVIAEICERSFGPRPAVDVQSVERPRYFSVLNCEVHFETNLQINQINQINLVSVGWSGEKAPHDLTFVVELVAKTSSRSCCNSPRTKPTTQELQNVIERSVVVYEKGNLSIKKIWLLAREPFHAETAAQPLSERSPIEDRKIIEAALAEARGRVSGPTGAAGKLGIPASTLESKIRSMNINKYRFKGF